MREVLLFNQALFLSRLINIQSIDRQRIIEAIKGLSEEFLPELMSFIEHLRSKSTEKAIEPPETNLPRIEQQPDPDRILDELYQVYARESSQLDPVLAKIQFMSLSREDW